MKKKNKRNTNLAYSFVLGVQGWLMSWVNLIPKLMYLICVSLLSVLDMFQWLMRKLAGVDSYYVGDTSTPVQGDIALSFIREVFAQESKFPAIKNAFWAIIVLSVVLLIVATIVAIIRQEYMPDAESSKEKPSNNKMIIVSRSIRSLFMFLIVPFSVLFGLMISNYLLLAIDTATSGSSSSGVLLSNSQVTEKLKSAETTGGKQTYIYFDMFGGSLPSSNTTFSGMMFKTAAYASNRVRINATYGSKTYSEHIAEGSLSNFGIFNLGLTQEPMAQMIDDAFANNIHLNTETAGITTITLGELQDEAGEGIYSIKEGSKVLNFSKFRVELVWYYYNLWMFNFIIAFAFLVVCAKMFVDIIIGLMKRLIELVALFLIAPPLVALMPLDEGKAFGKWKDGFLAKALGAYGAVVGMNIIFIILPYLFQIKFFVGFTGVEILNLLVSSMFIIVGLVTLEGFIALLSKMIGGDDVAKAGSEMTAKVGEAVKRAAMFAGGAAGAAVKVATGVAGAAGKAAMKTKTGQAVSKSVQNASLKAKSAIASLTLSKKKKEQIDQKANDDWERGEAEAQYNAGMQADDDYQNEMDTAYNTYVATHGGGKSREDWEKDDKVSAKAKATAKTNYETKFGQTLDQFKNDKSAGSARSKFVADKVAKDTIAVTSARNAKVMSAVYQNSGLQNLNTTYELFAEEMKDSMVRGGAKGGFKAMTSLFRGEMAHKSELAGLKKKLQKEESMRAKVQLMLNQKK